MDDFHKELISRTAWLTSKGAETPPNRPIDTQDAQIDLSTANWALYDRIRTAAFNEARDRAKTAVLRSVRDDLDRTLARNEIEKMEPEG